MESYAIYFNDSDIGHQLTMEDCWACDKNGAGFCEVARDGLNNIHSLMSKEELRKAIDFCREYFGLKFVDVATYFTDGDYEEEISAEIVSTTL